MGSAVSSSGAANAFWAFKTHLTATFVVVYVQCKCLLNVF